jgi:hypothetical protein
MSRIIWRRAHPVKLPARSDAYIAVHTELLEARRWDKIQAELQERISEEFERDLAEEER